MMSRSVKGLLVAVVVLLALNLAAQWAMPASYYGGPRIDRGGVVGMAIGEWSSKYIAVYRIHRDGTVEGQRVSKDRVLDRLQEGTWIPLDTLTAGDNGKVPATPAPEK
jgi:hypothetical protein